MMSLHNDGNTVLFSVMGDTFDQPLEELWMEGVDVVELWVFMDLMIAVCFIVWSDAVIL